MNDLHQIIKYDKADSILDYKIANLDVLNESDDEAPNALTKI